MTPLSLFLTAFAVGFSGAMMPGPVSTVTLAQSMRRGFWSGPLITVGHALAEGLMVVALAFGLGRLLERPDIVAVIACAGGLMLLWMGLNLIFHTVRSRETQTLADEVNLSPLAGQSPPVVAGIVTSLANPYWFLWWATTGASYIFTSLEWGAVGLLSFYGGHILSDLSWNSLLALFGATGRRFLRGHAYQALLLLFGLFLLGLGGFFLWSGVWYWI